MNAIQSIDRLCNLLRYHRLSQIGSRIVVRVRTKLFEKLWAKNYPAIIAAPPQRLSKDYKSIADRHLSAAHTNNCKWQQGDFCFLGDTRNLGVPLDWSVQHHDVTRLWRFHLHYHDFLLNSGANQLDAEQFDSAWRLVLDWIDRYPASAPGATSDGWHPFCISRRLTNWIVLWNILPPKQRQSDVLGSIVSQADFLASHLETDLGGNHLIENAHALCMVAAFFEERRERWLEPALRVLRSELDQQFLPSGEHFERSPMYHKHMIVALLDIRDVLHDLEPEIAAKCDAIAKTAIEFLGAICHQDGEIPLFSDSVLDDGPPAKTILQSPVCHDPATPVNNVGGYWVFDDGQSRLIFDREPAGPNHLMGHSHADLLNLVCSIHGQRWIVDTGVFDYVDSEMRQHCRRTAAHNVLEVDGENQFDMWSGFRVGRRGWPSDQLSGKLDGDEFLTHWASAAHDAYRHLGVHVGRWVACGNLAICCVDWIEGRKAKKHDLVSRIHLHPDIDAEVVGDEVVLTSLNKRTPSIKVRAMGGTVNVRRGWYCPSFGVRQSNTVVEVTRSETAQNSVVGWLMSPIRSVSPRRSVDLSEQNESWQLDSADEKIFRHIYKSP